MFPLSPFRKNLIHSFPDVRGGFQYNKAQFPRHNMLLSVRFHLKTRFIFTLLIPLFQAVPLFLGFAFSVISFAISRGHI